MLHLKAFTFNPFQENTYLVYDDDGTTFIIDPGNSNSIENSELKSFISDNNLKPSRLLLTHAHVDHIMGAAYVFEEFGLLPEVHEADLFFVDRMQQSAAMYGVHCEQAPKPIQFLKEGDIIQLGRYQFDCLFTPGHSPGSITFYNKANKLLIAGDVLFRGSIGRTDLPLGDHETLLNSIREKLLHLDDDTKVYSGHGPMTTIGIEKRSNPFLM